MNKLLLIILILYVCLIHSRDKDYDEEREREKRVIQKAIFEERRRLQDEVDELRNNMLK